MNEYFLKEDYESYLLTILEDRSPNNSLFSSNLGLFLFLFLKNRYERNERIDSIFIEYVEQSLKENRTSIADGLTGVSWILNFLTKKKIIENEEVKDLLNQLDERSLSEAKKLLDEDNHDYFYGAFGELFYLQSRLSQNENTTSKLNDLISLISNKVKRNEFGLYFNESSIMTAHNKSSVDVINFGISHGQASKIAVLSKVFQEGYFNKDALNLLHGLTEFLMNTRSKYSTETFFPSTLDCGVSNPSSNWWSYGDLGIANSLWQAGIVIENQTVKDFAIEVYDKYLDLNIDSSDIYEASLCRGTAGMSIMYRTMFWNTQKDEYLKKANYWLDETRNLQKHDTIDGFKYLNNYSAKSEDWFYQGNPYFLMGTTGVSLCFLSSLNNERIGWEDLILI